ncbi:kinase-like protein [Melanogaster broomeanus]|nr:kinase-like protein [Melanogaster broomeanus]
MVYNVDTTKQPPEPTSLADLSRNASVISSSSDSESSATILKTPRPRPTRTFSSPRSRSPQSPPSQAVRPPPAYLTKELGVLHEIEQRDVVPEPLSLSRQAQPRSKSRKRSRSQNSSANTRLSAQDFVFGDTLGEGSYSTVMRARHVRTGQEYAIKILDKNHLIRKEKMLVALAEKNSLVKLGAGHPGIIHLHWTFQDDWSLFFVLDLATNGEMQARVSQMGSLSLSCARYYAAQIVDAMEYMHDKDVIHRDLKPENLLLDSDFRIKITDFGTGKILESAQERANSFVGTAQYVSPELLERNESSKSSDLWSLGCIVFQMIAGKFAFQGLSDYLTWQKIKSLDYTFPDGFDEDAKDFVSQLLVWIGFFVSLPLSLLVRDPLQRLGASRSPSSPSPLRTHPFLAPINWETLWTDPAPPLEPGLVKKEPPRRTGRGGGLWDTEEEDGRWNDVGAKWDALADDVDGDGEGREGTAVDGRGPVEGKAGGDEGGVRVDRDGLGWAEDAEGSEFERYRLRDAVPLKRASRIVEEEVGPTDEVTSFTLMVDGSTKDTNVTSSPGDTKEKDDKEAVDVGKEQASENDQTKDVSMTPLPSTSTSTSTPIPIPVPPAANGVPGSGTNSSDGSLVDKTSAVPALPVMEPKRGRNRALTPVQGNLREADWSHLLVPGEVVLYSARVEARSPKRRGSRLRLPISVSPIRPKTRQLLLTTHRLLCVKQRVEGGVSLKTELSLRRGVGALGVGGEKVPEKEKRKEKEKEKERDKDSKDREKEKEKEAKSTLESAERKGEREFVVLTSTKSQTYAAESSAIAAQWVENITAALASATTSPPPRPPSSATSPLKR